MLLPVYRSNTMKEVITSHNSAYIIVITCIHYVLSYYG